MLVCAWKPDSPESTSVAASVPLLVNVAESSSVIPPLTSPEITATSLVPVIVMVTVSVVPSIAVAVKVSVSVSPAPKL